MALLSYNRGQADSIIEALGRVALRLPRVQERQSDVWPSIKQAFVSGLQSPRMNFFSA